MEFSFQLLKKYAAVVLLLAVFAVSLLLPAAAPRPAFTEEALGQLLFVDPILSSDQSVSCASCHIPAFGFADTSAVSLGVEGQAGTRNTPGITNMTFRDSYFWDGRAATLEEQVLGPIENPIEMNLPLGIAVDRLRNSTRFRALFQEVYQTEPDTQHLASALAAFIETLETGNTPFDRWMNDEPGGMSEAAVRGRELFLDKAKCFDCHFGPDFTVDEFRNIGLYDGQKYADRGRFEITKDSADLGKFKVPGLRNVAVTAPYMHDGSFKTLAEVIDYYDRPQHFMPNGINRDPLLSKPLGLTDQEKSDLEAFLHALTDDRFLK
jgi:cytochrome c peroxidase